jgi:Reverse transcriptase (RNA-dependent DNA polymerase)
MLAETFLPRPPPADLTDIEGCEYPEQLPVPEFNEKEVYRAIHRPGPDGIPNRILQLASKSLTPLLTLIFNHCIRAGYCPAHFRNAEMVAIRKPGKPDYSIPKAFRPIALLNTIGKVLEGLLACRISYLAEIYDLLPDNHFGGRRAETVLHAVVETIATGWKQGLVVTALFLDVSGAFDNMSHQRLLHNLRKRWVPEAYVQWLDSFLSGRFTTLVLPEYTRPRSAVNTGIPQGSPLSPILYLFYNADLVAGGDTENIRYIDDITIIAVRRSEQQNCSTLMREFRERCQPWSRTHASLFEPTKFQMVHYHAPYNSTSPPLPAEQGSGSR